MTLEVIQQHSPPQGRDLSQALNELQGLSLSVVAGAGAATPIAVAGLGADDTILGAVLLKNPAAASTAAATKLTPSIPSAGNVQFVEATNADANDRVLILWWNKGAL